MVTNNTINVWIFQNSFTLCWFCRYKWWGILLCNKWESSIVVNQCLRLFPAVCECGYAKKPLCAGRCELASRKTSLCSSWMRRRMRKRFLGPTTRDSSAATLKKFTCTGADRRDLRTLCGLEREIVGIRILSPRRGLSAFACGTCWKKE